MHFHRSYFKKIGRFFTLKRCFLIIFLGVICIWFVHWKRNLEVQTVIGKTIEGFETADIVLATAYISEEYHDDYGYVRADIIDIVKKIFKEFKTINITIEDRRIEFEAQSVTVEIRFKAVATYGPQRGYIVGSPMDSAEITIFISKEDSGWRIQKASKLRNTPYHRDQISNK